MGQLNGTLRVKTSQGHLKFRASFYTELDVGGNSTSLVVTKEQWDELSRNLNGKFDTPDSKTIEGFGITDAYTKDEVDTTTNNLQTEIDDADYNIPNYESLPLMMGQPMILFGAGTPQESVVPINWNQYDPETDTGYNWNGLPSALGQVYINTSASSNGRYTAVPTGTDNVVLAWKNF